MGISRITRAVAGGVRHTVTKLESQSDEHGIVVTEFGNCTVAHLPDNGEAWISGWVEVPR